MSKLEHIRSEANDALDAAAFEGLGCAEHGIVLMKGAKSWGAHERGYIELPTVQGPLRIALSYDEHEAPYAVDENGSEISDLLLSLTDEDDFLACAWARTTPASNLLGVGVDLSATKNFLPSKRGRDLSLLLFTEHERELFPTVVPDEPLLSRATIFASKEAAFKSTAAPLRRWYDEHDEQLVYEVRHFVMETPGYEQGTGRNGAAQTAMDRMHIDHVRLHHTDICGMALVVATALA